MQNSKTSIRLQKTSHALMYDCRYPDEVVITDILEGGQDDGTDTPAGEPEDDFFSSWDKPTIKRPSNPPSRTATPPVVSRTASPFLNAPTNGNGAARPKSPLSSSDSTATVAVPAAPAAARAIPSTAVRKTAATNVQRKPNILGAKKAKLGAKKVVGSEALDFEAAEKKAKEEAERIEKLGYDPNAEEASVGARSSAGAKPTAAMENSKIVSPTPVSPARAGFDATSKGREGSSSEMERLGMGMGRLGFGQVGGSKPAAGAPKKMGFGATGASRAAVAGESARM